MKSIWTETATSLNASLKFSSFESAMEFMANCAPLISRHNHHPEWTNIYNRLEITLTTHDAGNTITEKDRNLAQAIEELYWQNQL